MKNNISKYIFILVILVLAGIALYNLYKDEQNKENVGGAVSIEETEMVKLSDIRVGIVSFDTINPILSSNKNVQDLSKIIFDSLLIINEEHKIEKSITSEYSLVGEKDYLIKLKEGVKWHNGESLTSADVKFTIDTIKAETVNSIYKDSLKDVSNVEIIDELTVRINLSRQIPFFEYNLTFPIMSANYYSGEDFVNTAKNTSPIGTGAFMISSTDNGDLVLKRNDNWWNKTEQELPYIETIHIKMYANMGECYNAFKTSNIDFVTTSSTAWKDSLGVIGYSVKEYPGREYDFLAFNFSNDLLARKEVRQAITMGIDKNKINANVFGSQYIISNSLLDYGSPLYDSQTQAVYNFEQAQKVLSDAGWIYKNNVWQKTENYKTLRLNFNLTVNSSNALRVKAAENIKEDLEKVGIGITIRSISDTQYYNYLSNKNYEIILTRKDTIGKSRFIWVFRRRKRSELQ